MNLSMATRAPHIAPDPERLKEYDEYSAKARKQRLKHLFLSMLFGALTAQLIACGQPDVARENEAAAASNPTMVNMLWSFSGGKRDTLEKFVEELIAYNRETAQREIDPDEIVQKNREIIVSYSRYEEEDEQTDVEIRLVSDSDEGFTVGELLYKIHNRIVESLEDSDHHFFEGLIDSGKHEKYPDIPFYYLNLGS